MATRSMNIVDAIADTVPRIARARTAVIRFGRVSTAPSAGLVGVTIGTGVIKCNYLASATLAVNDWVCVLSDADRWIVLGKVVPST